MARRSAKPTVSPCPPGQRGGAYRPLSDADVRAITEAALTILADLGMGEVPARLAADLRAAGAVDGPPGRLAFPRALVEDAIAAAPARFVLHGQDEARSIEVGGEAVHFGAAVGA